MMWDIQCLACGWRKYDRCALWFKPVQDMAVFPFASRSTMLRQASVDGRKLFELPATNSSNRLSRAEVLSTSLCLGPRTGWGNRIDPA